jgi:hypothetical protein
LKVFAEILCPTLKQPQKLSRQFKELCLHLHQSHNLRKGKNKINNRVLHLRQEIKQDIQEASQDLKENANRCGNPSENQPKLL